MQNVNVKQECKVKSKMALVLIFSIYPSLKTSALPQFCPMRESSGEWDRTLTVKSDCDWKYGSTRFLTLYSSVTVSSNVGPELLQLNSLHTCREIRVFRGYSWAETQTKLLFNGQVTCVQSEGEAGHFLGLTFSSYHFLFGRTAYVSCFSYAASPTYKCHSWVWDSRM